MNKEKVCECAQWNFYITHYHETFYWHEKAQSWYVRWVNLSEREGYTQVSRYAIPMHYCPLCGGKLLDPGE